MVRLGIPNPEEKLRLLHGSPVSSGDVTVAYLPFKQGERVRFSSGTPNRQEWLSGRKRWIANPQTVICKHGSAHVRIVSLAPIRGSLD